ncbi:phage tail protein [Clostridium botulinum]|uniref:phage tail protein n=1 Tax=Clostridium botulinum TaxID=1491 RepID=UPI000773F502|nr:phage tail protein [Clostridium botulinum]MBY6931025.1 phage tail protein [Clostridium botulinum]NFG19930.1 hypothetical protein [Clostridium botulinum]NFO82232.1 hypothetical protein [Clostridium botulinum]UZP01938.1 phage tail protein [Clostridium botulinum]UZP05296.1 phage tail protein [Clostridium botulinum]
MSLGGFAGKTFEVNSNKIYTFNDYSNSFGISVEEQDVENDKPSNYIKGLDLEKPSFTVDLRQSSSVDVETEIKEWKELCYSKTSYMLFIGNTPVSENKYILEKGDISDALIIGSGKIVKCKIKLTFREHVRNGAKKEEGTSSQSKKNSSKSSSKKKSKSLNSKSTMSSEDESKVSALENSIFGG